MNDDERGVMQKSVRRLPKASEGVRLLSPESSRKYTPNNMI